MQTPLQITFRNLDTSDAVANYVRERAAKLERFHPRITGCHVALEAPHRHKRHGYHYRVRIDLAVPGGELVVSRHEDAKTNLEDLYAAIDAAFDGAQRLLEEHLRKRRELSRGRVAPASTAAGG
jgi:ribosomal subunit interface protein